MRVFNITDASTAALRERGLENQHIRVGDTVIAPGSYADLRGTARETSELQVYVKVRAVALDELPVDYAKKRGLDIRGKKLTPEPDKPAPEAKLALPSMPIFEESVTRRVFKMDPVEDQDPPKKKGK